MGLCSRGGGVAGGTMWALCLGPRAKIWGAGGRGTGRGAHRAPPRPAPPRPPALRPPPGAPGPAGRPDNPSCPHPGHRPASSAVSGRRGGALPREDGPPRKPPVPGRSSWTEAGEPPPRPRPPPSPPSRAPRPRTRTYVPGGSAPRAPPQPDCWTRRASEAARAGRARSPAPAPSERRPPEQWAPRRGAGAPGGGGAGARVRLGRGGPVARRGHLPALGVGRSVAGGACVTLRRRGVRALDRPKAAAGRPHPLLPRRPCPSPRGVPPACPMRPADWWLQQVPPPGSTFIQITVALQRGVASAAALLPGSADPWWLGAPEGTRPSPLAAPRPRASTGGGGGWGARAADP